MGARKARSLPRVYVQLGKADIEDDVTSAEKIEDRQMSWDHKQ